jgi:predicted ArsR family transcriptional regulator
MTDRPTPIDDTPSDPTTSKPRRRLLKLLRRSDTPLDVYQLAEATGLHITTVRFHLDVLARAELIIVQKTPRTTPGRPRTVYAARTEETPPDGYRPLAAVLAANFGPTPRTRRRRAEKVGQDWATSLIPATDAVATPDEAAQRIVDLFAEMNFDPELADPAPGTGEREIRLRACPYRDVARDQPDVVCAIHLGLLQGAIAQLGDPATRVRLEPFVKPHLCLAYLTPHPPAGVPSTPGRRHENDRKLGSQQ